MSSTEERKSDAGTAPAKETGVPTGAAMGSSPGKLGFDSGRNHDIEKHVVRLSDDERAQLSASVKKGKTAAYRIGHANIMLKMDAVCPDWTDEETAVAFGCHVNTVANVRRRFVEQGLDSALERKPQDSPPREGLFDSKRVAQLMATDCSQPLGGRAKWTLQLLADRMLERKVAESVSPWTVERTLKKELQPHRSKCWVIPPKQSGEFLAHREDVPDIASREI